MNSRCAHLLREVLDLPPGERQEFLRQTTHDDTVLLATLQRLLEIDSDPDTLLDTPLDSLAGQLLMSTDEADEDFDDMAPGDLVGAWRLVTKLGSGGMGSVWLAARADGQYEQEVALKTIKLGMDSSMVLAQFRRERNLLARLSHPNIASLVDGGVDARGRPWFAMDHVPGVSVRDWIAGQPTLEQRLHLFRKLCLAVAHAHQQLVIHRDIKPSNVLVQSDGEPKLLDFGIAKLLVADDDESAHTATVHAFASRNYAAPEQLQGGPITTAVDVYALGALLFELLTGVRYTSLHTTDSPPRRPSQSTATPGADGTISRALLRGDLDAIVSRALAEEPERRYPSVLALADDVGRHLDGKPIEARPDSFPYRARKFMQRNRAAVAVGTLGLIGLLLASGLAFQQALQKTAEADRARVALRQSESARNFTSSLLLEANPGVAKGTDTTIGEILAVAHQRALEELANEPEIGAEILAQIGNAYISLDNAPLARAALEDALAFNRRARQPSLQIAAQVGGRLAFFRFSDGDPDAALAELDALARRVEAAAPAQVSLNAELGKLYEFKGNILYAIGRKDASRQAGIAAVRAWSHVRHEHPASFLGAEASLADLEAALGDGTAALRRAERVLADPLLQHEDVPPALAAHARGARIRGLQALGRHADAEPLLTDTIAEFSRLVGADASFTRYWRFRHAETLHALGRLEEAQAVANTLLALPPDGSAAYRRTRVEVLAARIAHDRGAGDATTRVAAATVAACDKRGNEELCRQAHAISADTP